MSLMIIAALTFGFVLGIAWVQSDRFLDRHDRELLHWKDIEYSYDQAEMDLARKRWYDKRREERIEKVTEAITALRDDYAAYEEPA